MGLQGFYFLAPPPLGDDLAFLILAPSAYPRLVLWDDIKSGCRDRQAQDSGGRMLVSD